MLRPVFTAAIFTAAFLLFWVQPLFGKMLLPLLGGSPAVWLTAMVFYQGVLLLGYTYAHGLTQLASRSLQVAIHVTLLLAAFVFLPFLLPEDWQPTAGTDNPALAILHMMAMTIGMPLLVLSASSPLLQKWFADSTSANPYPLYAASNAGSLTSLLLFPFLIEVIFPVHAQTEGWRIGFGLLMILFASCMLLFIRSGRTVHPAQASAATGAPAAISWRQRGLWLLYAFVPSSLLLGVTQYITTDIGAVALLWIVPLILYLLTFIIAFSEKSWISLRASTVGHLVLLVSLLGSMVVWGGSPSKPLMLLHLAWFFLTALMCHQFLFTQRPAAAQLTQFYLFVSLGGFLGGVFNALIAPQLFTGIWEYMLIIALAVALRPALPQHAAEDPARMVRATLLVSLGLYILFQMVLGQQDFDITPTALMQTGIGLSGTAALAFLAARALHRKPLIVITTCALFMTLISKDSLSSLYQARSFFGAYKVRQIETETDGSYRVLLHGTTLHGAQRQDRNRTIPRTYYHPKGPFGAAIESFYANSSGPKTIAAVGLGTGALSCYQRPGDTFTFFEIDPEVVRIARNPQLFTYLRDCAPDAPIVIGDARLTLQQQPAQKFDAILLDAFSSDAIPMHLLTREALTLYLDKLKPGGMIFYHISNRHLDLEPVIAALAQDQGLEARSSNGAAFFKNAKSKDAFSMSITDAVIVARTLPETLRHDPKWAPLEGVRPILWTDDHSNILSVLRARR